MSEENHATTIAHLALEAAGHRWLHREDGLASPVVALHHSMNIQDLESHLPAPVRIRAEHTFRDPGSLAAYVNRYKQADTIAKVGYPSGGHMTSALMLVLLDYHGPENPRWVDHKAKMEATHSIEWAKWLGNDGKMMSQRDFADFLDDNLMDVFDPPASDLMDMIKTINVIQNGGFSSSIDLTGGGVSVSVSNEVKAKAGADRLDIPRYFTIRVPIYEFRPPVEIKARVRVRPDDGNLKIAYRLQSPERIERNEWDAMVREFEQECEDVPVYRC